MHERDELADIEARAAAQRHDAIMLAVPEHLAAGEHVFLNRVRPHVGEEGSLEARLLQVGHDVGHHRHGGKPFVGDNQRPLDPVGLAELGELLDAARAILDGGRIVDVAIWNGHVVSPDAV